MAIPSKWVCQKCGACCELLMPGCPNYQDRECKDFENRPWMCRQHLINGDKFAIETCVLLRRLRKYGQNIDRDRLSRIVSALASVYFGADEEEVAKIQDKATKDKTIILADMEKYKGVVIGTS